MQTVTLVTMPATYVGSPIRKKPKNAARAAAKNPSKSRKPVRQQSIVAKFDVSRFKDLDILLTDAIYKTEIPDAAKNKLFHYRVLNYDEKKKNHLKLFT